MTDPEWLTATNPQEMLTFLHNSGKLTDRKARLFACACCRRIWHLLNHGESRRAVQVAEQLADRLAKEAERAIAHQACSTIFNRESLANQAANDAASCAAGNASHLWTAATFAADAVAWSSHGSEDATIAAESRVQAALLRDIFGPLPFRPLQPLTPSVRTWNDGTVVHLAQAAYEERELPSGHLDRRRLAVLADALEEAGCHDADILGHLRQQGAVHVRGCFVVDLLLGKE